MEERGLINKIKELSKTDVNIEVNRRIEEFKQFKNSDCDSIFKELCYCILTANYNAEKTMKIQKEVNDEFLTFTEKQLAKKLRELGYRFPNIRAEYIYQARKQKTELCRNIHSNKNEYELREWLVKNIKGLGYKESSHLLRNIGYENCAIIDFHIIDLLSKSKIIEKPKTLTKRKYLEIEQRLRDIARKTGLNLAQLDLYLWFLETGKVLK
ncbi:MAG: N-glycosylase/DNA lyase [Candidatus Odinarchaeia archaeon]